MSNTKTVILLFLISIFSILKTERGFCEVGSKENNLFEKSFITVMRDTVQPAIIKGRVVSYDESEPLYWANITIKGTSISIKVDSVGKFLLKFGSPELPLHYSDNIVLVVHCLGFDGQEIPILLLKKKKTYVIKMKHDKLWYTGE